MHFGVNVMIDFVRSGSLPRTTSGKLSRFRSRYDYLERLKTVGESKQEPQRKTACSSFFLDQNYRPIDPVARQVNNTLVGLGIG